MALLVRVLTHRERGQWRDRARSNPAPNEPKSSAAPSCRASREGSLLHRAAAPCTQKTQSLTEKWSKLSNLSKF